jgi:hypothetical protein
MPFPPSRSARGGSSLNLELPPSITMSPVPSRSLSSSIVASVTCDGTMIQITRGAASLSTRSLRPAASETSGLRS